MVCGAGSEYIILYFITLFILLLFFYCDLILKGYIVNLAYLTAIIILVHFIYFFYKLELPLIKTNKSI